MKAYMVSVTFSDGEREGAIFTSKLDAKDALNKNDGDFDGSALAVYFADLYGNDDPKREITEIEI